MRRRHVISGVLGGAAFGRGFGPGRAAAADAVKEVPLGAIVALTGPASVYAVGDAASIRLAVKEIEGDGGFTVSGQRCKFVLREEDTGSKPQQVVAATQKMLDAGDVTCIVGPTTTGDWVAAWGLLSKADVINISFATAVLPYLGTPAGRNLFFPNRGIQAPVDAAVAVAAERWHPKTAALLIPGDAVGQAVGPLIRNALAQHGVKIVYDSTFAPASREFSAQLTAIKAVAPDVLVSGYFDDMMSTVMRQAVELGVVRKFIGMRGVSEASGLPLGNKIDGLIFPLTARDPSDPEMQDFDASYEKYFGKKPDRTIANGIGLHDAIMMLAAAMEAAGTTTDADRISAAMRQVTSYKHATLGLKFGADGMAMHVQEIGVYDGATGKTSFVGWQGLMPDDVRFPMPRECPMHPPAEYARFRMDQPLTKVTLYDGSAAWLITRFRDVRQALGDDRLSAVPYRPDFPKLTPAKDALYAFEPPTFFRMDPPEHGKYRGMLASHFAYTATAAWRERIQGIVDRLIDGMVAKGPPVDFVTAFANALPSEVITEMLGVPYEDHHFFEERTNARLDLNSDMETVTRAGREMLQYIDRLLAERERAPDDDGMLSRLVIEQIRPGHLSHEMAVPMAELMLRGGHETTASQISMGMLTLLLHPDQFRLVQDDPALVKTAVEEMLRFNTIVQYVGARVAIEDLEIGGQTIRKGRGVYALISAANRDPGRFADPDRFDVARKVNPHLAFGFGTHGCIGQLLARAELQIAFTSLLARLPGLALAAPPEEIEYKSDFFVYGPHALPITWSA